MTALGCDEYYVKSIHWDIYGNCKPKQTSSQTTSQELLLYSMSITSIQAKQLQQQQQHPFNSPLSGTTRVS